MNKRDFLKNSALISGISVLPSWLWSSKPKNKLRTAQVGVGGMQGLFDIKSIASHKSVEVVALCDVDDVELKTAKKVFPNAKTFKDYRKMLDEIGESIDAISVCTPDHSHAPISIMAMKKGIPVYCQKPLTHNVSESREMLRLAKEKNLVTQMGIQVHSFYDYKLATFLIQSGIIGKVKRVRAWCNKSWGYDGTLPEGKDEIPASLDWNLWLGTAKKRPYKEKVYHPHNWRRVVDFGCGTLGDMGVHIFDTPYNALNLDVPFTVKNICRNPNGFSFPEANIVNYKFPGTEFTTDVLEWIWEDGIKAPKYNKELTLPNDDKLPDMGAMFIGEKGKLLLPHFMQLPKLIVKGKYKDLKLKKYNGIESVGKPVRNYETESVKHYHEFVDACLGKGETSAPFSYSARLTETILLGVIASRFPNKTLNWNSKTAKFKESEVNKFLGGNYREF